MRLALLLVLLPPLVQPNTLCSPLGDYDTPDDILITCKNRPIIGTSNFDYELDLSAWKQTDVDMFFKTTKELHVRLKMSWNPRVQSLDLSNVTAMRPKVVDRSDAFLFHIANNLNLENIKFNPNMMLTRTDKAAWITNNPSLNNAEAAIRVLHTDIINSADTKDWRVQLDRECTFEEIAVTERSAWLNRCRRIRGDLVIKKDEPVNQTEGAIEEVEGCVSITSDKLVNINLEELKWANQSRFKNSENLCKDPNNKLEVTSRDGWCPGPLIQKRLQERYDSSFQFRSIGDYENCKRWVCFEWHNFYPRRPCTEMYANVTIANGSQTNCLTTVTKIVGKLHITAVEDPKILEVFARLEEVVGTSEEEPAIYITKTKLYSDPRGLPTGKQQSDRVRFFPNLRKVTGKGPLLTLITDNSQLRLDDDSHIMKAHPGDERVQIECDARPENHGQDLEKSLRGCKQIDDNGLEIGPKTIGKPPQTITFIRGCLRIVNSKLTALDFLALRRLEGNGTSLYTNPVCLDKTKNVIKDNRELCILPSEERRLKNFYDGNIVIEKNKNQDLCRICSYLPDKKVFEQSGEQCIEVLGDVAFDCYNPNRSEYEEIEEIRGSLKISSCKQWRGLKNHFPRLKRIAYRNTGLSKVPLIFAGNTYIPDDLDDLIKLEIVNDDTGLLMDLRNHGKPVNVQFDVLLQIRFGKKKILADPQECLFPYEVNQTTVEKTDCELIRGDLLLGPDVKNLTRWNNLREIQGCVVVLGEEMTDYEWIRKLRGRKTADRKCFAEQVGQTVGNKTRSYQNCTLATATSSCQLLFGDVIIDAKLDKDRFKNILEIHGRLIVNRTSLVKMDWFPKLEMVQYGRDEDNKTHVLYIVDNKKLELVELPSLRVLKGKVWIEGNDVMNSSLINRLGHVGVVCRDEEETSQCFYFVRSSDGLTRTELIVIIVCSVIGGLLLIGLIALAVWLLRRKKKQMEEKKSRKYKYPFTGHLLQFGAHYSIEARTSHYAQDFLKTNCLEHRRRLILANEGHMETSLEHEFEEAANYFRANDASRMP